MKNLFDLTKEELAARVIELGGKKFNSVQVFNWVYKKRAVSFSDMSNLSKILRPKLEEEYKLSFLSIIKKTESRNKDAVKYLFELADGKKIESVLMLQPYGNTLCVSTQVGCAYGCFMCATGKMGLTRNLLPGEMTGQLLEVERNRGVKVKNVVFMGMGEPLANYDNLKKAITIFSDSDGICINQKRITVSTCGIIPGIKRLVEDKLRVRLSVSLHSTFDSVRSKLVPVNKKYKISSLLEALRDYCLSAKLQITIEYVLIEGMNDGISEAENLI
ncbi:MAG: 23S rRNA (adenine(2503)-C(2))-methyltransferase RlmN, partial [Candidatus Firestonebacteria bacterium]